MKKLHLLFELYDWPRVRVTPERVECDATDPSSGCAYECEDGSVIVKRNGSDVTWASTAGWLAEQVRKAGLTATATPDYYVKA